MKRRILMAGAKQHLFGGGSLIFAMLLSTIGGLTYAQQPAEPTDPSPLNGEIYYLVSQISGLQADAATIGVDEALVQDPRSFTSLSQRWALTLLPDGNWKISNMQSGFCVDSGQGMPVPAVQQACEVNDSSQEWVLGYTTNGYDTLQNAANGLLLDVSGEATTAGTTLVETAMDSTPSQGQLWLLRPAFFRCDDNALLAKQEDDRLSEPTPFFNDAGQIEDSLRILKNHGINMLRLRPTPLSVPGSTTPLYNTYTLSAASDAVPATCKGNGCTAETDAADLELAKRAKALGMSVELSLFFDGANSAAAPAAWTGYTVAQTSAAVYAYVKAQIEEYRAAGVMPDLVSIGNEVDTGFFATGLASGASGSPSGAYNSAAFKNFAVYQQQGMQAVLDAAADTSLGPAIPAPLRCIHTTPAWLISSFYEDANQAGIPYDMVCQSYYPMYHGPLTAAQAVSCTSTKSSEPEETNLSNGASGIGKPIFMIEIGERYESGAGTNDCFYPVSRAGQRQFALDMQAVIEGLSDNLGAGIGWWNATGTHVPLSGGGLANNATPGVPYDLYSWTGLTLFDDADSGTGSDNFASPTYNTALPTLTAVGGRLDPTLAYKLVNTADQRVLELAAAGEGALDTGVNLGLAGQQQQWRFTSNGDGTFQIANLASAPGTVSVLDNGSLATVNSTVTLQTATGSEAQKWDVITAANGTYTIVNNASALVLASDTTGNTAGAIEQQTSAAMNADWITPANSTQQWAIVPVHITVPDTAAMLGLQAPRSIVYGTVLGNVSVTVQDATGSTVASPAANVTLEISGSAYSQTFTATTSQGVATFALTTTAPPTVGVYTITASASGLTTATSTLTVTPATLIITAANASRAYGAQNPAFMFTISGFVNGDGSNLVSGTAALSTSAVASSAVGTYAIDVSAGTLSATNYAFVFLDGTLTVTQAMPALALAASASVVLVNSAVTLSVTLSFPAGSPDGTVAFYDVTNSVNLGSETVSGSVAAFTLSTLAAGAHSITAMYSGNTNLTSATSAPVSLTVAAFTLTAAGAVMQTVQAGSTATFALIVAPVGSATLPVALSLNAMGLPAGATAVFTPASIAAGAGSTNVSLSIATPVNSGNLRPFATNESRGISLAALLFLLILYRLAKTRKRSGGIFGSLLIAFALCSSITAACLSGCGGNTAAPSADPKTYTVVVGAAAGTSSESISLTLTVTP